MSVSRQNHDNSIRALQTGLVLSFPTCLLYSDETMVMDCITLHFGILTHLLRTNLQLPLHLLSCTMNSPFLTKVTRPCWCLRCQTRTIRLEKDLFPLKTLLSPDQTHSTRHNETYEYFLKGKTQWHWYITKHYIYTICSTQLFAFAIARKFYNSISLKKIVPNPSNSDFIKSISGGLGHFTAICTAANL